MFTFSDGFEGRWVATLFLAGVAMVCLPRQFQVAVVENSDERHLATASWLFPLYMLLLSLFVVPIAISGLTQLPDHDNPDLFVLTVPMSADQGLLALLAFIGGLSAATSMVIVSSIALSIMISNHLVMPILLRLPFMSESRSVDFTATLLLVRRLSIIAILTLGFLYYRLTASSNPLASIGLISFAGVAQFLPALVGGVFWRRGTHQGAIAGLVAGFAVWAYTLLVPSFADARWAFEDLVADGPMGIAMLRPTGLFGLAGWDSLVHGLLWSMTANVVAYCLVSLLSSPTPLESLQSAVFVNALSTGERGVEGAVKRSAASRDIFRLAHRILGPQRAHRIFQDHSPRRGRIDDLPDRDEPLIAHVERELASTVGAASARSLVSRIVKGETISLDSVIEILDRTQQAVSTSHALERKSRELEITARQLREANEQLTRLDRMKDDFLSSVSHELRTPMTSIRSFAEILTDGPAVPPEEARRFLEIIHHESQRLTRLLDEILDLSRLEAREEEWELRALDCRGIVGAALETMRGLAERQGVVLENRLDDTPVGVAAESDRLKQVLVNLLSNAIKHNDNPAPRVWVTAGSSGRSGEVLVQVGDNGPGIPVEEREVIFSKFGRSWTGRPERAAGSGLGLAISRQIMLHMGGNLRLETTSGNGTVFTVVLRPASSLDGQAAAVAE